MLKFILFMLLIITKVIDEIFATLCNKFLIWNMFKFWSEMWIKTIRNIQFALDFVAHIEPLSYGKSKFDKDYDKNLYNFIHFRHNSKLFNFSHQTYVV